jgi:hypothetical protein
MAQTARPGVSNGNSWVGSYPAEIQAAIERLDSLLAGRDPAESERAIAAFLARRREGPARGERAGPERREAVSA